MNDLVTLILILHNRHKNLDRLLDYYKNFSSPLIIADSSDHKYVLANSDKNINHIYTPNYSFTQKIEHVLSLVQTPYVVLCADDDFIIADSIYRSVQFLQEHNDFAVAQGIAIQYKKDLSYKNSVNYGLLYIDKTYDAEDDEPSKRLQNYFYNYRSVLYAVHRTEILEIAYKNAGDKIKNLYLNEYLSCILPIIAGKYKELPILYQVREFTNDSDDKITPNLDRIFVNNAYKKEREAFIDLVAENIGLVYRDNRSIIKQQVSDLLIQFSKSSLIGDNKRSISLKKRMGLFVKYIPYVGKWLIQKNRKLEKQKQLQKISEIQKGKNYLSEISILLEKYTNI